ncbi:regulatory protein RecX [Leucobacter sp. W1153]|uniref:regulatory protein RecX n=1 Tax=Leucobacter sp. W1153 TaxID=3439064 RepID=UPI003F2C92AD
MSGDRADLAEVIELRSRLPQVVQAASGSEPEPEPEPARSAKEDGVRLLARRALSSGELRNELLSVGHPAFEVDSVIDEFVVSLYLDDLGLARAVTESLRDRKGASRSQIRMKLRDRMVSPAAIEEALGELNEDEEFSLLRAAAADRARKMGGLDRQTAERRLLGFLARRGWSGEPASRAVREALDGALPQSGVRFQ